MVAVFPASSVRKHFLLAILVQSSIKHAEDDHLDNISVFTICVMSCEKKVSR